MTLRLNPEKKYFSDNEVEVFFDENQILLEMHKLELEATVKVRDMDSGQAGEVRVTIPISTGNVAITPNYEQDGKITKPRFNINEVKLEYENDKAQIYCDLD